MTNTSYNHQQQRSRQQQQQHYFITVNTDTIHRVSYVTSATEASWAMKSGIYQVTIVPYLVKKREREKKQVNPPGKIDANSQWRQQWAALITTIQRPDSDWFIIFVHVPDIGDPYMKIT